MPAVGADQGEPSQDESLQHQADTTGARAAMLLVDSAMRQLFIESEPEPLPILVGDGYFQLQTDSPPENRRRVFGDMTRSARRRLEDPTPPPAQQELSAKLPMRPPRAPWSLSGAAPAPKAQESTYSRGVPR